MNQCELWPRLWPWVLSLFRLETFNYFLLSLFNLKLKWRKVLETDNPSSPHHVTPAPAPNRCVDMPFLVSFYLKVEWIIKVLIPPLMYPPLYFFWNVTWKCCLCKVLLITQPYEVRNKPPFPDPHGSAMSALIWSITLGCNRLFVLNLYMRKRRKQQNPCEKAVETHVRYWYVIMGEAPQTPSVTVFPNPEEAAIHCSHRLKEWQTGVLSITHVCSLLHSHTGQHHRYQQQTHNSTPIWTHINKTGLTWIYHISYSDSYASCTGESPVPTAASWANRNRVYFVPSNRTAKSVLQKEKR